MRKDDWEVIATLYRYPNLTKAAEQLYLTQPALTKRLRLIEESFGVVIANRNSKGVTFTPEGEYLAHQAEKYAAFVQETMHHLQRMGSGEEGTLRIASPTSFARTNAPAILNRYRTLYPKVDVRLEIALSGDISKMVQQQQAHVGFVNGEQQQGVEHFLFSSGQAFIISGQPIKMADLPRIPLILSFRDKYSRGLLEGWWKNNFQEPRQVFTKNVDMDTCKEMVRNGLGYSVMYSNYLRDPDEFYKIPMCNRDGSPLVRNTWMVYPPDYRQNPLVRNFVSYIRETAGPAAEYATVNAAPDHP